MREDWDERGRRGMENGERGIAGEDDTRAVIQQAMCWNVVERGRCVCVLKKEWKRTRAFTYLT